MANIADLMTPFLLDIAEPGAAVTGATSKSITLTLPKIDHMSYRKTMKLIFEGRIVDEVLAAHAKGDQALIERVGKYLQRVLKQRFEKWDWKNVQFTWHVGSEALDK